MNAAERVEVVEEEVLWDVMGEVAERVSERELVEDYFEGK